jgi:hypothetical protein
MVTMKQFESDRGEKKEWDGHGNKKSAVVGTAIDQRKSARVLAKISSHWI